jgi:hypothetical protein
VTRRDVMIAFAAGTATMFASGCSALFPSRYRFRMTVEVETPQGLRVGSSVMEVSSIKQPIKVGESPTISTGLMGDAVAIDLPNGTLFALVGDVSPGFPLELAATLALEPGPGKGYFEPNSFFAAVGKLGRNDQIGRTVELSPGRYPKLVHFRDIRDSKSVEVDDPLDLSKTLGTGIRLRKISIQVTDSPPTSGIERKIQWLDLSRQASLDEDFKITFNPTPAQSISFSDFSTRANR